MDQLVAPGLPGSDRPVLSAELLERLSAIEIDALLVERIAPPDVAPGLSFCPARAAANL